MFRFLKYIVLFILGYKVIKMLFAENKSQQTMPPMQNKQNINSTNSSQSTKPIPDSKFNDAEPIDYEEVR